MVIFKQWWCHDDHRTHRKAWYLCRKRRRSDRIFCTLFILSNIYPHPESVVINASMTTGLWACQLVLPCPSASNNSNNKSLHHQNNNFFPTHIYFFPSLLHRKVGSLTLGGDDFTMITMHTEVFQEREDDPITHSLHQTHLSNNPHPWVVLQRWPLGFWACQLVLPIQVHKTEAKLASCKSLHHKTMTSTQQSSSPHSYPPKVGVWTWNHCNLTYINPAHTIETQLNKSKPWLEGGKVATATQVGQQLMWHGFCR